MTQSLVGETSSGSGETHANIPEALTLIDQSLRKVLGRELVSSGETADILLDLRLLLTVPVEE